MCMYMCVGMCACVQYGSHSSVYPTDQPSLVVNFVKCLREDSLSIDKKQVEIGSIKSTSVKKVGTFISTCT